MTNFLIESLVPKLGGPPYPAAIVVKNGIPWLETDTYDIMTIYGVETQVYRKITLTYSSNHACFIVDIEVGTHLLRDTPMVNQPQRPQAIQIPLHESHGSNDNNDNVI